MYIHAILLILVSAVFGWISFDAHVMLSEPTLVEAVSSLLFVVILFVYSASMGKQNYVYFQTFITQYWSIGLLIYLVGYFMLLGPLFYSANFLLTVPIYGALSYFFEWGPGFGVGIFSILFLYFLCIFGGFLGHLLKRS